MALVPFKRKRYRPYKYTQYSSEKRRGMKWTEKKARRRKRKKIKRPSPLTAQIMWIIHQIYKHIQTHTLEFALFLPYSRFSHIPTEYIRQFSKMRYAFRMFHFRRCCVLSCSLVAVVVVGYVVFFFHSDIPLFFSIGEKWSKHYLRFLDIRICYLRWDVRGTNFQFVPSIWNGAFVYMCVYEMVLCTLSIQMHERRQWQQQQPQLQRQHHRETIECHIVSKMRIKPNKNNRKKKQNTHILGLRAWEMLSLGFVVKYSSDRISKPSHRKRHTNGL